MLVRNPPGQVFPAQVSLILERNATRRSLPRDYLGAKLFHRRQMFARGRGRSDNYSRHAHRGGAPTPAQALERRRDLVVALGDSVPSIAEFRRPLERRLGIAAEHDWRMRLLRGL